MLRLQGCTIGHNKTLYTIPNLKLEQGEFVALIGANGSGKSTLMHALIHGEFSSGNVTFNDSDWNGFKLAERAKLITLVDNHFLGLDYLNVSEYLNLGRYTYTDFTGRLNETDRERVTHFASKLHLEELLHQPTSTLSDGERQRAGIAKALIQETPIVLLDEPTAFLDYPTKKEVMSLLSEIAREDQKLILIASHDLDFCLKYCSRILVIEKASKQLTSFSTISQNELVERAFGI